MENLDTEQIEKIKTLLNSLDLGAFNQSLIKDNKIIFILDDQVYRCHMPTQKALALAEDLENRLTVEYSQKPGYVSKKKWKEILKENQGIDIDELECEKEECQNDLKNVFMDLAGTQTSEAEQLKKLKQKKQKIEDKLTLLIIEITEHLSPSIEAQVRKKYYAFLTFQCTEKAIENEKWEKIWNQLEDYEEDNSKVAINAVGYLQTLLLNIRD